MTDPAEQTSSPYADDPHRDETNSTTEFRKAQEVRAEKAPRATLFPRVTSFRSRSGNLRQGQQRAMETLWPTYGRNVTDQPLDIARWFGRSAPVIVEIGSGTGTSTLAMAQDEPEIDVIAVEVYLPGIAQLLGAMGRENVTNIRLIRGDGVSVLTDMIRPEQLDGIRIFFPDPWPKARHHKRRLLQPETVQLMASRIKPGGMLHIATDHAAYAQWITEVGEASRDFISITSDFPFSVKRPVTKFERKGHDVGHDIHEFYWKKVDTPNDPTHPNQRSCTGGCHASR